MSILLMVMHNIGDSFTFVGKQKIDREKKGLSEDTRQSVGIAR